MTVGTRLKQQRIAAGLEIKEVAHLLGKSYQYVRQIEEGINDPPTWGLLADFARIYQCSVDALLGIGLDQEVENEESFDEVLQNLFKAIYKLPKYRQRDLLAMAEMFLSRSEEDDTLAMRATIERVSKLGGQEAATLLLDLLRSLNVNGANGTDSTTND